jgi:type III secretory pathway lipoprotein EscJ
LRRELQNSEKALNDIDGLVGATVNGQQAKGTNDELRAAALLLLHERMTKLQARVDEIKLALDSNLAPNELDIQNISVRIADAEAKVSAGDTPFELDMQRQQSEVDKARREIDAMSPASAAPVFASPRPVEPRRSLVLALSFFFGGAAGVVYLLWARWQRSQDPA